MPTRFDTPLGRRVTERIARSRATQERLAQALGCSRPHLNQMVTGRKRPWHDLEQRIERVLGEEKR